VAFLAEPVDKIALKSGAKPEAMHFASLPRDQVSHVLSSMPNPNPDPLTLTLTLALTLTLIPL
jgi:hypothetical protein